MNDERIEEKIREINKYLEELDSIKPISQEEYVNNLKEKAACERYFEKIIEAVIDLGFMILKSKSLGKPEDDSDLFNILERNNILDSNLSERMKEAKGMKNFISHQYGEIDDKLVFNAVTKELEKDTKLFIEKINQICNRKV